VLTLQAVTSKSPEQRIDQILTGLAAGKRREQIAIELSYKNYKSLDLFMKRNKYCWDHHRNYYFPISETGSKKDAPDIHWAHQPDSRTASILSLLNQGVDLKLIAEQLRFSDHRELALFMKTKGYIWCEEDKKYHYKSQSSVTMNSPFAHNENVSSEQTTTHSDPPSSSGTLIDFLEQHKNTLYQLISSHVQQANLPRYTMPGVYITKSISMNYGMDMLVRSYSQDKNVSQKDIVEIALVDFFCKYGFSSEVNTLLGKT
jgi:hypothetical protein